MRLIDIFERAIKLGIKNDIRADVDNKIFYALSENPYPDSAVLYGDNEKIIKNLFVCIDIDVAEVLLVDQLIKKGYEIDGILSHHPSGKGL
jgi:hypothetical protein